MTNYNMSLNSTTLSKPTMLKLESIKSPKSPGKMSSKTSRVASNELVRQSTVTMESQGELIALKVKLVDMQQQN